MWLPHCAHSLPGQEFTLLAFSDALNSAEEGCASSVFCNLCIAGCGKIARGSALIAAKAAQAAEQENSKLTPEEFWENQDSLHFLVCIPGSCLYPNLCLSANACMPSVLMQGLPVMHASPVEMLLGLFESSKRVAGPHMALTSPIESHRAQGS